MPRKRDADTEPVEPSSSGMTLQLAAEGEPAEGARRFGCPNCGAKHDVTYPAGQTPGTWAVSFACLAGCGHALGVIPVTG